MRLLFSIKYRTNWGETVKVELSTVGLRGQQKRSFCTLNTTDGYTWQGEAQLTDRDLKTFTYRYCIFCGEQLIRQEWNGVPRCFAADITKDFIFPDHWNDFPELAYLYSSVFTRCIHPRETKETVLPYFRKTLQFRVSAPQLKPGQALALLGSIPALGEWQSHLALRMHEVGLHEWGLSLSAVGMSFPFEYKYVVVDAQSGMLLEWELGDNRISHYKGLDENQVRVISDDVLRIQAERWKGSGVVIPLFSLRSEQSCGVGDFGDLKKMADWARLTGMNVIQLLPIYDTTINHTWTDSYPYNSISIYALHPQYVDLNQLPPIKDEAYMTAFRSRREELNALPQVDYEQVMTLKTEYLQRLYAQEGSEVLASKPFTEFFRDNRKWLMPYAVFCFMRDKNGTADFRCWPSCSTYRQEEVEQMCRPAHPDYAALAFFFYVQYVLHVQLVEASRYARSLGIVLKGDIPIGISRNSVEAWVEPFYFNDKGYAGAPPDDFSVNGQNWGFPTYNWEVMQQDGYRWWVRRFSKMAEYFDAYRIDHVLGFFRIWEIPAHSVHGLLGQFSPALPMSVEEIESYGLPFRKDFFTLPYITDRVLVELFGDQSELVKQTYLIPAGRDWYEMKPEYATQRQVEAAFADRTDKHSVRLREGLYTLISDVLFVPDRSKPNYYHPRISAQKDFVYKALSSAEREAFDALYEHYYYHRHNDFWYGEAMRKLPALVEATSMLVCAEDLGMVPACVPWVMNDLRILTLEIQTMPKQLCRFGRLEDNPYRSVSTIFTHDMPTLRGWWEEDPERSQAYYNEILQKDGKAPAAMPGWLCQEVVARHLFSPSMLCLISWQDWLSIDDGLRYPDAAFERINVPANPKNYWHYRMHLTLETLMNCRELNTRIREMIEHSGRRC